MSPREAILDGVNEAMLDSASPNATVAHILNAIRRAGLAVVPRIATDEMLRAAIQWDADDDAVAVECCKISLQEEWGTMVGTYELAQHDAMAAEAG